MTEIMIKLEQISKKSSGVKNKNGDYNSLPDEERGTKRSSFGRGLCADPAKGLRTLKAVFVPTSKENTPDNGKVTSTFFIISLSNSSEICNALFVFLKSDLKQNARSLLTPVSDPDFHALSHGSLSFALHGSFFNHFLIGQNSSTANQNL